MKGTNVISRTLSVRAHARQTRRAARRMTLHLALAAVLQAGAFGVDPSNVAQAQTVIAASDFENGRDGWYATGDPRCAIPEWRSTGGNPNGRIRTVEQPVGAGNWLIAPPKFLGDQSTAYGGLLSFELAVESQGVQESSHLSLIGDGLVLRTTDVETPARWPEWSSYAVELVESGGWVLGDCAPDIRPPTREEFMHVLSTLSALRITTEFGGEGGDRVSLDNVVLTAGPCDLPNGRLTATCKEGQGRITAKLSGGLPNTPYEFCLDSGDCVTRSTNRRGQAKVKFTDVAPGQHEVSIPDCDLVAPVECR